MSETAPFAEIAGDPETTLDEMALALAGEFQDVDASGARARLDALGADVSRAAQRTSGEPEAMLLACRQVLGGEHGFTGDQRHYDNPVNSMLDRVLERRRGLPILLSVVYVEVARRAGIRLAGVGLPGHFVVGHFGADPPILVDPFTGGSTIRAGTAASLVRPWGAPEIAMRMLNNLVASFQRRGDVAGALRAATLRLTLPVADAERRDVLTAELRTIQARLN